MSQDKPNMDEVVRQEVIEALKALEEVTQGNIHLFGASLIALTNDNIVGSMDLARVYDEKYAVIFANAPAWLRNALERERLLIEEREQREQLILDLQFRNADLVGVNVDLKQKVAEQDKEIQRLNGVIQANAERFIDRHGRLCESEGTPVNDED